jgi:hypothetical protein
VPVISKAIPVAIAKGSCHQLQAQYLPGGQSPLHQPVTASSEKVCSIYLQSMVTLYMYHFSSNVSHARTPGWAMASASTTCMWLAEQA